MKVKQEEMKRMKMWSRTNMINRGLRVNYNKEKRKKKHKITQEKKDKRVIDSEAKKKKKKYKT